MSRRLAVAAVPAVAVAPAAQTLIGVSSSVFGPTLCAVSLGLVGRSLFDRRQGRNQTFNAAGNVIAAVAMGIIGYLISNRGIFFFVVAFTLPTLWALSRIRPDRIDYEAARGDDAGWVALPETRVRTAPSGAARYPRQGHRSRH